MLIGNMPLFLFDVRKVFCRPFFLILFFTRFRILYHPDPYSSLTFLMEDGFAVTEWMSWLLVREISTFGVGATTYINNSISFSILR
jgi:hypothetical protein